MICTDYGIREVTADEIAKACGSAAEALRLTKGDNATALFILHNPGNHSVVNPKKGMRARGELADALRKMIEAEKAAVKQQRQAVQVASAKSALREKPSVSAVMKACGVSRKTAKELIQQALA